MYFKGRTITEVTKKWVILKSLHILIIKRSRHTHTALMFINKFLFHFNCCSFNLSLRFHGLTTLLGHHGECSYISGTKISQTIPRTQNKSHTMPCRWEHKVSWANRQTCPQHIPTDIPWISFHHMHGFFLFFLIWTLV